VLDVDTGSAARAGDTAMVPAVKEGDILIQRQSEHREHAHERANERESEREKRRARDQDFMRRMPEKLSSLPPKQVYVCKS
jgi:hypothetical protein